MPSIKHQIHARVIARVRRSREATDPALVRRERLAAQAKTRTGPPTRVVRGCVVSTLDDPGFPVHDLRAAGLPART